MSLKHALSSKREEELEDELDLDDDAYGAYREQRFRELKMQQEKLLAMRNGGHGEYIQINEEKDFLKETVSTEKVVVHFMHKDFRRCDIMDSHLEILAEKHFKTKFVKCDVEKFPFFVERLGVKVLPCVVCFVRGVSVERIVGFDDLGGSDSFSTEVLEYKLAQAGVLELEMPGKSEKDNSIFGYMNRNNDDDSGSSDSDDY